MVGLGKPRSHIRRSSSDALQAKTFPLSESETFAFVVVSFLNGNCDNG